MPKEIERRWLLPESTPLSILPANTMMSHITQGYLSNGLRVRIETPDLRTRKPAEAWLTRKTGKGLTREEYEVPLTLASAGFLLETTSLQVSKTRFTTPEHWQLDVFKGNLDPIKTLECEFASEAEAMAATLPSWLGTYGECCVEITRSATNRDLAELASLNVQKELLFSKVALWTTPKKIVFTGAPCAGKSRAIRELCAQTPYNYHGVPEVASILIAQLGLHPTTSTGAWNRAMLQCQIAFEDGAVVQARKDHKQKILLDRGLIDLIAFAPDRTEQDLCLTQEQILSRYDEVLFLETPSEDVYNQEKANNPARYHTYAESVAIGERLEALWSKHPHFTKIHNGSGWNDKFTQCLAATRRV